MNYIKNFFRKHFTVRGNGFSGGGTQKRRSDQMSQIRKYFPNQVFIKQYPELLFLMNSITIFLVGMMWAKLLPNILEISPIGNHIQT